ncbi:hypothetical protein KFL_000200420 [Klebsormidium nitens]|uniref:HTH La-type RNA-binding domain-containing protein n=1 Tax=Klebsormidium nitens TaxID=105231 RepID=A0A1Y1HK12_KLENI|nr:hypothetical protein KFL_000200420 [Klebsormidium nitens]|eukprot:GAQ78890.1 hypothetical protein KFL_000200420 [Klebsormidium nitens]
MADPSAPPSAVSNGKVGEIAEDKGPESVANLRRQDLLSVSHGMEGEMRECARAVDLLAGGNGRVEENASPSSREAAVDSSKLKASASKQEPSSADPATNPASQSASSQGSSRVKLSPAAAEFVPMSSRSSPQASDVPSQSTNAHAPASGRQQKKQRDRAQGNPLQTIHGFSSGPNIAMQAPGFTPPVSMGLGPIPQLPTNVPLAVQQHLAQQFILQREAMMLMQQQQQQGLHPQMRPPLLPPQMPQHFGMMQTPQQFPGRGQPFPGPNQGPHQQFQSPNPMFSGPNHQFQGPNRQFPPVMHQAPFQNEQFRQPMPGPQQHTNEQMQQSADQMQGQPSQSRAAAPPEISEELREKIVKQVEFYLSDQNLPTDNFLMKLVRKDPEGWVPIKTIGGFNKIKSLSKNHAVIAQAVRSSQQLVVSSDGKKVRRAQPLPDVNLFDIQMRTVVAENLPSNPTIQGMEALFSQVGKVNMVRICHPEGANSATQSARDAQAKFKDGPSLLVSTRQHALIEMESFELADRACAELTDRQNWRSGLQVRPLVRRQGLRKASAPRGDSEGEGTGTEGEGHKERKLPVHPDGAAPGRGKGRGQQGQPANGPGTQNRDPSPARAALPKGPRMPDGTKGFVFGRGRTVNALGRSMKPIGEPPAASGVEAGTQNEGQKEGAVDDLTAKAAGVIKSEIVINEAGARQAAEKAQETEESANVSEQIANASKGSIAENTSSADIEATDEVKPSTAKIESKPVAASVSEAENGTASKSVLPDGLDSTA